MSNLTNSQKLIEEMRLKADRSELGRAAFTNDFQDLDNIPTETIVNNSTITFQKNWVQFDSTTTNAAQDKTINIQLTQSDVWLGNVDNTSDADKPISNATQTALNAKANANNVYTKWEVDSAISTAISSVYRYKGSVLNYNALPVSGQVAWDVYNVETEHTTDPKFAAWTNVAWTWSAWDPLSWSLAVDGWTAVMTITQEQYDALPASEKQSNTIFLIEGDWPGGGITVAWNNVTGKPDVMINPINWSTGQVLTKTSWGYAWANAQSWSNAVELTQAQYDALTPEEKAADVIYLITGQWQTLTIAWSNVTDKPDVMIVPSNGNIGQVLTKTANGYEWSDGWSNAIKLTQVQYDALTPAQKQADVIYLITWTAWEITVAWNNVTDKPDVMIDPGNWNTGDVLTKTASGFEWAAGWWWSSWPISINYTEIKQWSNEIRTANESASLTYTPTQDWWLMVQWQEEVYQWKLVAEMSINWSLWWSGLMSWTSFYNLSSSNYANSTLHIPHREYLPVKKWQTITITQTIRNDSSFSWATSWIQQFCIRWFFYYSI